MYVFARSRRRNTISLSIVAIRVFLSSYYFTLIVTLTPKTPFAFEISKIESRLKSYVPIYSWALMDFRAFSTCREKKMKCSTVSAHLSYIGDFASNTISNRVE